MSVNLSGLSTDNTPPAEAPLRLFLVSPISLVLAGIVLFSHGDLIMNSRWSPPTLACVHLIVLGSITPVMCGALLQVAPVLMGAPLVCPSILASVTGTGLLFGSCAVAMGFYWQLERLLWAGGLLVAMTLIAFVVFLFVALRRAGAGQPTANSTRLAALALLVTLVLGLTLAAARNGWIDVQSYYGWVQVHLMWGVGGWIGLLVLAVGMEIIPMFYVTPSYPMRLKIWLPWVGFAALLLALPSIWMQVDRLLAPLAVTMLCVQLVFAAYSIVLEQKRQRPRRDSTLWFWQFGHLALFFAGLSWWLQLNATIVGLLLLGGALAIVFGALLKIAPFISWLDLQQAQVAAQRMDVKLPRVRQLLPERTANWLLGLFLCVVALLFLGSLYQDEFARLGGAVLILFALLFATVQINMERRRRTTRRQFKTPIG